MAYRLTWSPTARFDLRVIFAYIAEDDPVADGGFQNFSARKRGPE